MNGVRTLFTTHFEQSPEAATAPNRGRSSDLDAKRNKLLATRYGYYNLYHRSMSYEAIISALSNEFYISPRTITNILTAATQFAEIQRIKKEMPPVASFRRLYPHLVWL